MLGVHRSACTVDILAQGTHSAVAGAKERSQQLRMAVHRFAPTTVTQHGHELWGAAATVAIFGDEYLNFRQTPCARHVVRHVMRS